MGGHRPRRRKELRGSKKKKKWLAKHRFFMPRIKQRVFITPSELALINKKIKEEQGGEQHV